MSAEKKATNTTPARVVAMVRNWLIVKSGFI